MAMFKKILSNLSGKKKKSQEKKKRLPTKPRCFREQHLRAALIVRTENEIDSSLEQLLSLKGFFRFPPQNISIFSLNGGSLGVPRGAGDISSFYHVDTLGLFDLVCLDSRINLFDTIYGISFVNRMVSFLNKDGVLLLPEYGKKRFKGALSSIRLVELLGEKCNESKDGCWTINPFNQENIERTSLLNWYLLSGTRLVLDEITYTEQFSSLKGLVDDSLVQEFLLDGELVQSEIHGARKALTTSDLSSHIQNIVNSHAYLINGISYKVAVLQYIITSLIPDKNSLTYADIGGGYGAVAAELLLSLGSKKMSKVVIRDIAAQNIFLARSLYAGMYSSMVNRFKFSLGPAETFNLEHKFDVVSFIGSLLYVEKNKLSELLDRIWDSIHQGGLLIVHENIKNPAFKEDYDKMFEVDELTTLLKKYGEVRCFLSTSLGEVPSNMNDGRTLFRVVQK